METIASDDTVLVQAAIDGRRAAIVLANPSDEEVELTLDTVGFDATDVEVLRIDDENRYTMTGESLLSNMLIIPPAGCVEIKLWNLK